MSPAKNKERLLVVDDSPKTLEVIQRNLSSLKYTVFTASGVTEAIAILKERSIDLVITDIKMPKISGHDLIRYVRENFKETEIIVITGYPSVAGAIKAVKTGAEEYLAKPFTDQELSSTVRKVLDKLSMRKAVKSQLHKKSSSHYGIVARSKIMLKVLNTIEKAASTSATVLITGESGTGKELVARAIHYSSKRVSTPFVPVNCGGIPENLLESELFGYLKGSFTGATESRAGFFQTADGGTIFLDEISETSTAMQVKLLRVLQDKEVFMIGSRQSIKVDVRILAATNKDLLKLVKNSKFRADLYYRLNVINIDLPPLRDRGDDILLLIQYFASKFATESGTPVPTFTDKAISVLGKYYWPGNVRELENVIQRLIVMNESPVIDIPELPSPMRFSIKSGSAANKTLAEIEAEHIRNVLESVDGNKTHAAKVLDIDRKTLREKLKKMNDHNY